MKMKKMNCVTVGDAQVIERGWKMISEERRSLSSWLEQKNYFLKDFGKPGFLTRSWVDLTRFDHSEGGFYLNEGAFMSGIAWSGWGCFEIETQRHCQWQLLQCIELKWKTDFKRGDLVKLTDLTVAIPMLGPIRRTYEEKIRKEWRNRKVDWVNSTFLLVQPFCMEKMIKTNLFR